MQLTKIHLACWGVGNIHDQCQLTRKTRGAPCCRTLPCAPMPGSASRIAPASMIVSTLQVYRLCNNRDLVCQVSKSCATTDFQQVPCSSHDLSSAIPVLCLVSPVTKLAMVIPLLCLLSLVTKYMINRHDQVQIPLPRTTGGLKKQCMKVFVQQQYHVSIILFQAIQLT